VKEKLIIFSISMVQAILDGSKTQTRRVIKPQPKYQLRQKNGKWHEYSENPMADETCNSPWGYQRSCPFVTGQRFWVRETFTKTNEGEYIYRADPSFDGCGKGDIPWNWTPAIFMPRKAARLFLEVKNVRVERIQDISEMDALAEGCNNEMLNQWAKDNYTELEAPYWISGNNEVGEAVSFCAKCGEEEVKRLQKEYPEDKDDIVLCGGVDPYEDDSPTTCESCAKPLAYTPTGDCVQSEYEAWNEYGLEKSDSYLLEQIAWDENFFKEYPKMSRILFRRIWEELNKKRGYPWEGNPWVWVIEFRRIEK
jgi:hypothetical protein